MFAINLTEDGGENGPDPVASARAGAGNIRTDAEMNAHISPASLSLRTFRNGRIHLGSWRCNLFYCQR